MASRSMSGARLASLLPAPTGATSRSSELADAVGVLVDDGRLLVGTKMPSERDLATALSLSRGTITRAYDRLREHGRLVSRRGAGTVVARVTGPVGVVPAGSGPVSVAAERIDLTVAAGPGTLELQPWFEAAVADLPRHLGGSGLEPHGLPELREAVATGFARRGLPTSPGQIIITTGALAGLSAVTHALAAPGDRVLLESPAYPGSLRAVRAVGARPVGLPVEAFGAPEQLRAALRQSAPSLAVLTPDFHNPTGSVMDAARRRDVARALAAMRVVPIIDETLLHTGLDPDAALPPPFAAGSPDAVTLGSTSKSHWGGLRVGWIRSPHDLVDRIAAARAGLDVGASIHAQLVVTRLLAAGVDVMPHVAPGARERRDILIAAVRDRLPDWEFDVPGGGSCLWCRLPVRASTALAARCRPYGVVLAAGSAFAIDGAGLDRFVRLPFALPGSQLVRAVDVIAGAWQEVRGGAGARGDRDLPDAERLEVVV